MVVTGLLLLFGGRADAARVRTGADQASVDGRLRVDRCRWRPTGSQRRRRRARRRRPSWCCAGWSTPAGRSRAYVGGAAAPVAVLAELAEPLLAVHGQSDQLRLTRPADAARRARPVRRHRPRRVRRPRYAHWRGGRRGAGRPHRRARPSCAARPICSPTASPRSRRSPRSRARTTSSPRSPARLGHADALRLAARGRRTTPCSADPTTRPVDATDVGQLLGRRPAPLGQQHGADPELDALAARLAELGRAGRRPRRRLRRLRRRPRRRPGPAGADREPPGRAGRARPQVLRRARSRASTPCCAGPTRARRRLAEIDVSDEALAALRRAPRRGRRGRGRGWPPPCHRPARPRRPRLAAAVTAELAGLAMAGATLRVEVRPRPAGAGDADPDRRRAEVGAGRTAPTRSSSCCSRTPGAPALPLARGASGGELSRVMLALEVCLAGTDPVPTMVFDEVDAGVGGRAAVEVGRRLARLARDRQVIVVTHLAQVAAFADRHVVVDKPPGSTAPTAGSPPATSGVVTGDDRVAELARMLAGSDTATAREHAAELLADAGRGPRPSARSAPPGASAGEPRRPSAPIGEAPCRRPRGVAGTRPDPDGTMGSHEACNAAPPLRRAARRQRGRPARPPDHPAGRPAEPR